jgi:hypothetical protein
MNNQDKLSHFQSYSIGAITGLAEVLVTNPFFIMKTNVQQGRLIPWKLGAMYKGAGANAMGFVPITSIQVGASQWMDEHLFKGQPNKTQQFFSAFTAGAMSSVISCPIEKIMTLQNNMPHLSLGQTFKYQLKEQGLKGLFSGQMATLLREGSFSVFFLIFTPILKTYLHQCTEHETGSALMAGIASGVGATLITQPFDTIKTIQQSSASPLGFFKTAQGLGLGDLFKGILSRGSSVVLSITLMSMLKQQLEDWCKQYNHSASKQY